VTCGKHGRNSSRMHKDVANSILTNIKEALKNEENTFGSVQELFDSLDCLVV